MVYYVQVENLNIKNTIKEAFIMTHDEKYMQMKDDAVEAIIKILDGGYNGYYYDLHNKVFNTDYYIIGTYRAKAALREFGVYEAIALVQVYEMKNFDKVYTGLFDPEGLINMVYYIIGKEVICNMHGIEEFEDNWNNRADDETNAAIVKAMKSMFNI